MSEKRFKVEFIENVPCVIDYKENIVYGVFEYADLLNSLAEENKQLQKRIIEQQHIITSYFEELLEAQKQGYVVNFLHKREPCSIIPKERKE